MNFLASTQQLRAGLVRWTLICVPLVLLLGTLSGTLSGSNAEGAWFAALEKPAAYPQPAAFVIVWGILYAIMGMALALVISAYGARGRAIALIAFAVQLALNLAWSPIFFGAHRMTWALIDILLLDLAVVATIVLFARVRPTAAWLFVPYLAWLLFASYLNWAILQRNPHLDGAQVPAAVQRIEF